MREGMPPELKLLLWMRNENWAGDCCPSVKGKNRSASSRDAQLDLSARGVSNCSYFFGTVGGFNVGRAGSALKLKP